MNKQPLKKNVENNTLGAFNFVVDALAQFIALIVSIFLPISFGSSQGVAKFVAQYKYEIIKITALSIGLIFVIGFFLFQGGFQQRNTFYGGGSTEITDISGVEAVVLDIPYFNQYSTLSN